MKIDYLKEFVVLAELLNFRLASERLYITQSGLSRHISILEHYFAAQLFRRSTQSVTLTNEGQYLYDKIKPILEEFDELRVNMLTQTQNATSTLRIGLPQFAMNDYLGELPKTFQEHYPHIELSYFAAEPDLHIESLFNKKVDVILISNEPFPGSNELKFHDLHIEPLVVLLSEKHKLADRSEVFLEQLSDETFLCVDSSYYSVIWTKIRALCLQSGFEPKGPIKHSQMEAVLMNIRYGVGVTIVGNHLRVLATQGIKCLRLKDETCVRQQSFAYLKDNQNPAIPLFLKTFDELGNKTSMF